MDPIAYHEQKLSHYRALEMSVPGMIEEASLTKDAALMKRAQDIRSGLEVSKYLLETAIILNEYLEALDCSNGARPTSGTFRRVGREELDELSEAFFKAASSFDTPGSWSPSKTRTRKHHQSTCPRCGPGTRIVSDNCDESCSQCGHVVGSAVKFQVGYNDLKNLSVKARFTYKRVNHFNELLNRVQARGNVIVDPAVMDSVVVELKKNGITDPDMVSTDMIRRFLKRLRHNKHYGVISYIYKNITGKAPVTIAANVEDQLRKMFLAVQDPYSRARPEERLSFLSYPYTLLKLAEMLGLNDVVRHFKCLKSVDKNRMLDYSWKQICDELGWPFYATV